jgi:hypothetical protein
LPNIPSAKAAAFSPEFDPIQNEAHPERNEQNQQQSVDAHVAPEPRCCTPATSGGKNRPAL